MIEMKLNARANVPIIFYQNILRYKTMYCSEFHKSIGNQTIYTCGSTQFFEIFTAKSNRKKGIV